MDVIKTSDFLCGRITAVGGLILHVCARFIDGRAQEHSGSCSGTKKVKNALPDECGDGIKDAKGKYLLRNIQESVAHKANLRKPLFFGNICELLQLMQGFFSFVGGKLQGRKTPQKGHSQSLLTACSH